MAISDSSFENKLDAVAIKLKDVPISMRLFSLSMRSLYAEKAVSGSSDTTKKINKLRDDTKKDAVIYSKGILPLSTKVVAILKEFFEYYEGLTFEKWEKCLCDILKEVKGCKQFCVEVIRLHEEIMITLKRRQDDAKVFLNELDYLTNELKTKKEKLEEAAVYKQKWASNLLLVPYVNLFVPQLLKISADKDMVKAVADGAQCNINEAVISVVSETLIPALSEFIKGLECIAGFFEVVEGEITTFQTKGEKAAMENSKVLHYNMMNIKSKEIKQNCTEFIAMIPSVRTDFDCIPVTGTDQNYVDRWLKEQQAEIKKRYKSTLYGQSGSSLTYYVTDKLENLLVGDMDVTD